MLNSFKTLSFSKGGFDWDFLSAHPSQMGGTEWEEVLVLVLDCKAALKLWLARMQPVTQVEHPNSGNVVPVLGLPSRGQQQTCAGARGAVGSFLSPPDFSDVLLGLLPQLQGTQLWFVTVWTCWWWMSMRSQACTSSSVGGSVPVVRYRQHWSLLLQVSPAGFPFDKFRPISSPSPDSKPWEKGNDSLVSYKTTHY